MFLFPLHRNRFPVKLGSNKNIKRATIVPTASDQRKQLPERTMLQKLAESATRALGRWRDPWFDPKYMPELQKQNPIMNSVTPEKSQADNGGAGNAAAIEASEARRKLLREKLYTTFQGGALRFLPMDDGVTDETPEMRSEYIKIFLKEPSVKSAMMSKIISVVSSKMSMEPANQEDPVDQRVAKWATHILTRSKGGIRKIGENILLFALTNGHSLNEKVYEVKKSKQFIDIFPAGYIGLKQLKIKKPEDYRLEVDQFRNIRGVWSNRAARRFDPSYFCIASFMPMYENPAGTSDLRSAIRAYNLIQMAQQLRAIWAEQFSMPLMEGHYPPDDKDAKAFVEDAIQNLRALGWYVAPDGTTIRAIDVATRGQAEFQQMIDDLRKEIYLCIVGSYLQAIEGDTEGGAGNSETHRTTFELFQWYLCEFLAEVINDQILPDLVGLNFSGVEPPRCSFAGVNDGDLLQSIAVYQGIKTLGLDLSKKKVRQKFEIDPPEDEEDKLAGETPQPAMSMGGGLMAGLGMGGDQEPEKQAPPPKQPDQLKKDATIKPLQAMKMSEGSGEPERFANGPKMLWKAMQYMDRVKLSDVGLAREMNIQDDGLTDFGTMMRTARYHGVFYEDIDTPSFFNMEDDINDHNRLVLTSMQLDENQPASFVIIQSCNLKEGWMKILTPNGREEIDPETFLSKWPGNTEAGTMAKRRVVILSLEDKKPSPKEGESAKEPAKHSEGDSDDEDGGASGNVPGSGVGPRKPVSDDDIPAGPDGRDVYKLLNASAEHGGEIVTEMAKVAAARMLKTGNHDEFFNESELQTLSDALTDCLAPADLLGRASVLLRLERARKASESVEKFSEQPCGMAQTFAEGRIRPMAPARALDYFKSLVPSMNLKVDTWGDSLRRKTFTMAEASNKIILGKVQKAIAKRVAAGDNITGTQAIDTILRKAGIHPSNPDYPRMVFRTNYMDMFNVAAEEQRLDPDVVDEFPVWRYMGIDDGRQGKDHEIHFGKYYPSKAKFKEVRGERIFNCRCQPVPIYKTEWARLKSKGVKTSSYSMSSVKKHSETGDWDENPIVGEERESETSRSIEKVHGSIDKLVGTNDFPSDELNKMGETSPGHWESLAFGKRPSPVADGAPVTEYDFPPTSGAEEFSEEKEHDYCSTQFDLPHVMALKVMGVGERIKEEDLTEKGREDEPHITVLYGIHDDKCLDAIADMLRTQRPIVCTLRRSSVFEKDDCDVVKLNVDSPELHRLRDKIEACCDNTQTYPYYQPHVTLAYVKKGEGAKYSGILDLEGTKVKLADFTFRSNDETATQFKLGGDPSKFSEVFHGKESPGSGWQSMPDLNGVKRWKRKQ